jgi:predicted acetyltransferase
LIQSQQRSVSPGHRLPNYATFPRMDLRLRPFRISDESAARTAHEELARESFPFLLGWDPDQPWAAYVQTLENRRRGLEVRPDWVPATFLAADVAGDLVGRVSIRHELNEFLENFGGHIGYGVRPQHRRRGFATEILRQALIIARSQGVDEVLLTCDEDNLPSATIIDRLGGVLEDVRVDPAGPPKLRYWIR